MILTLVNRLKHKRPNLKLTALIFSVFICTISSAQQSGQMHGLSLVSVNQKLDSTFVTPIENINADWVCVMPYAYQSGEQVPIVKYNAPWQWRGERLEGARETIKLLQKKDINILLKPHLWIGHGFYTGHLDFEVEKDRALWQETYQTYILDFARLAEEEDVELFSVGTELRELSKYVTYWDTLIQEVRKVYSGELTYAANWDDYHQVGFWDKLDYIGIDAYFPVATNIRSSKKDMIKTWDDHLGRIDSLQQAYGKQIIFTEYGYRSIAKCGVEPWDFSHHKRTNEDQQIEALEALYEAVWTKSWFAGGFLWNWYPNHESAGGSGDSMFTVQNKEAEAIVRDQYAQ